MLGSSGEVGQGGIGWCASGWCLSRGQGPHLGARCWPVICLFPSMLGLSESASGGLEGLILGWVVMLVGVVCRSWRPCGVVGLGGCFVSWASWLGGCVRSFCLCLLLDFWCGSSGSSSLTGHFQVVVVDSIDWCGSRAVSVREGVVGDLLVGVSVALVGGVFHGFSGRGFSFTSLF